MNSRRLLETVQPVGLVPLNRFAETDRERRDCAEAELLLRAAHVQKAAWLSVEFRNPHGEARDAGNLLS